MKKSATRWWSWAPVAMFAVVIGLHLLPGLGERGGDVSTDRLLAWVASPRTQVGGVDAPDWAAFGEVTDLAWRVDGSLLVLDGQRGRVVGVSPGGDRVLEAGRPGEGPGEFRAPVSMTTDDEGRILVLDAGHAAVLVFGEDGAFQRQIPLQSDMGLPRGGILWTSNGVLTHTEPSLAVSDDPDAPGRTRTLVLLALDPTGSEAQATPVLEAWRPPTPSVRELTPEETGGMRVRLDPVVAFRPELLRSVLADGHIAVVDSFDYRVRLHRPDGSIVDVWQREVAAEAVTEEIRERERARRLAELQAEAPRAVMSNRAGQTSGIPRSTLQRLQEARVQGMGFHDEIPVIQALRTDPQGRLWVFRSPRRGGRADPPNPAGDPTVGPVDIWSADGVYLGTAELPGATARAVPGPGGFLAVPGLDALSAPVVHILQIQESGPV